MIFPQVNPGMYDDKDRAVRSRMEKFYAESISINQSFWGEADTDTRFEAGDQLCGMIYMLACQQDVDVSSISIE